MSGSKHSENNEEIEHLHLISGQSTLGTSDEHVTLSVCCHSPHWCRSCCQDRFSLSEPEKTIVDSTTTFNMVDTSPIQNHVPVHCIVRCLPCSPNPCMLQLSALEVTVCLGTNRPTAGHVPTEEQPEFDEVGANVQHAHPKVF